MYITPTPEQLRHQLQKIDFEQNEHVKRCAYALIDLSGFVCIYVFQRLVWDTTFGFDNVIVFFVGLFCWRVALYYWCERARRRVSASLASLRRGPHSYRPSNRRPA